MKYSKFQERMEWAKSLTSPSCLFCTKSFDFMETAIVLFDESIGKSVYFHTDCYNAVVLQSEKAHALIRDINMGFVPWSVGTLELDVKYPFRKYAPERLKVEGVTT